MKFENKDIDKFSDIVRKLIVVRTKGTSNIPSREFHKIGLGSEYPRGFSIEYFKNTRTLLLVYEIYDYAYSDGLDKFVDEVIRQKFEVVKSVNDPNFHNVDRILMVGTHSYQLYVTGLKFPNLHIRPYEVSKDNENEVEHDFERWWRRDYPDIKCEKLEIKHIEGIENAMKNHEHRNTEEMRDYVTSAKKLVNTVYGREIFENLV